MFHIDAHSFSLSPCFTGVCVCVCRFVLCRLRCVGWRDSTRLAPSIIQGIGSHPHPHHPHTRILIGHQSDSPLEAQNGSNQSHSDSVEPAYYLER